MLKYISFCCVAVTCFAVLTITGCSTQDVVKKDEGIAPTQVTKKVESPQPATPSARQELTAPVKQSATTSAPAQPTQSVSAVSPLSKSLEKIYFDFDSANLSAAARSVLTNNAALLNKDLSAKIRIEGNCDERGSAEYNLALGERRAKSAQQYLVTLGVKADRLSTISYGKEKPAVQGSDETFWSKNRRDEFVIVTVK